MQLHRLTSKSKNGEIMREIIGKFGTLIIAIIVKLSGQTYTFHSFSKDKAHRIYLWVMGNPLTRRLSYPIMEYDGIRISTEKETESL